MKVYALAVFSVLSSFINTAQSQVPMDFNQDGVSDLTIVEIKNNGVLSWSSLNTTNSSKTHIADLGEVGNNLILANWDGNSIPEIGVVAPTSSSISWKIRDSLGVTREKIFGKKNDYAISGADFNGNGIVDAAVARQSKSKVTWNLSLDTFSQDIRSSFITFGSDQKYIFYASPDGIRDNMAAFSKDKRGRPILRLRDAITGKIKSYSRFPSSVFRAARPFPVKQSNGIDILGFSTSSGGKTKVEFRRLSGSIVSTVVFPETGDIIVGDYLADPGEEVGIKKSNSNDFLVYNPSTRNLVVLSTISGIGVDTININKVSVSAPAPTPIPNNPAPPSGDPNWPGRGSTITCSSVTDINSLPNVLYKNENIHGSRGRTWLDQGHRLGKVRRLYILGSNGIVFGCFGLYACDNPYGCRYYQAMCGDPLTNSQFIEAAKQGSNGSTYAFVSNGSGACYRFKADTARYGNIIK